MAKKQDLEGRLQRTWRNLIFTRKCIFCQRILPLTAPQSICENCAEDLPFCLDLPRCRSCGRPIPEGTTLCSHCADGFHPFFSGISAVCLYEEEVRAALLRMKSFRYQSYASFFAPYMAALVRHHHSILPDGVVSVPPRKKRMEKEAYDQAETLARLVARALGVPFLPRVMRQVESRQKQSLLSESERFANVIGNYRVIRPSRVAGKRLLLVDDICTTGATLNECAKVLRQAGAVSVHASTAAIVE